MEQTPEEILERLIRYRDSLVRANQLPAPPSWSASAYPADPGWRLTESVVLFTLLGLFLAVAACVLAVMAFAALATGLALVITGAMTALGVWAATRRLPGALWWTAGALIGGVLGCLS